MADRPSPLVLVTRPQEAAASLKRELEAKGYATLVEPMLTIEPFAAMEPLPDGVQAILLTSANAVPALRDEAKKRRVFAVGKATAEAARASGCKNVLVGDGDGLALASLVAETCRPEAGALLHVGGEVVREDLHQALEAKGFHIHRKVVYRAAPATGFSDSLLSAWRKRRIKAVLLFSPRTAEILVRLLIEHGLRGHVDTTAAICVSEAAATPCRELDWREICLATRPNQTALIRSLEGSLNLC
jgi:uroporphyrinogen-III synthase